MDFQFPRSDQRTFVSGRTGSGKTVFGLWLLANQDLDKRPWFLFDYKLDPHLKQITRTRDFKLHEKIPTKPGLYHVKPELRSDDEQVELLLRRIWREGEIGIYFDEGYSVPQGPWNSSFRTLMTQGRSLRIPIITLTQRPAWIDKFAVSEADFYAIFHLNQRVDRKRVEELLPDDLGVSFDERLDEYCCRWYDVNRNWLCELLPAPKPEQSIAAIEAKLRPKRKWL